jgi:hypothetical protein
MLRDRLRNRLTEWRDYRDECEEKSIPVAPLTAVIISVLFSIIFGIFFGVGNGALGCLAGFVFFCLTFPASVLWLTQRRDKIKNELALCDDKIEKLKAAFRKIEDDLGVDSHVFD